jgi:hypothetical protein
MSDVCAECGSRDFESCFSESFPGRGRDGTAVALTLRLCLSCGARFPARDQLRSHLLQKLPGSARPRDRA